MTGRRFLLLVFGLVGLVWLAGSIDSTPPQWRAPTLRSGPFTGLSWIDAKARAEEQGRYLLVDFTADWCPPCRAMERTTWTDTGVLAWIEEQAVAVRVDVDVMPSLAAHLLGRGGQTVLPTMSMFRGTVEQARVTGYRSARQLLDWFDEVQAGRGTVDRGRRVPFDLGRGVDYDVPDVGVDNPWTRLGEVRQALDEGRDAEALDHAIWFWAHAGRHSPMLQLMRAPYVAGDLQTLLERHPPARERLGALLEQAEQAVTRDPRNARAYFDWLGLCGMLDEQDRLLAWYEEHRDGQGRLDTGLLSGADWLADGVYVVLIEAGRLAEAGRVYSDPVDKAEARLALIDMSQAMSSSPMMAVAALGAAAAMRGASRAPPTGEWRAPADGLRFDLARMSAATLAAGRDGEALAVGLVLLSRYDDAASRVALVEQALAAGRILPDHVRWFAEAEAAGAEVADLEDRLVKLVEAG